MIQLSPTSTRPPLLAFAVVAIIALLIGMAIRSGPVTSVVTATGGPTVAVSASVAPTAEPTPFATRFPPLAPTPTPPCTLPETLPVPDAPVATPVVERNEVSTLFTSYLYERGVDGQLIARSDKLNNWAVGLWFAPAKSGTPRLIAETTDGMVLPLALSPNGDAAAVWWIPDRRSYDQVWCDGGIYLVSTATQASRLLVRGDWTMPEQVDRFFIEPTWTDPIDNRSRERSYLLPDVAISRGGDYVAIRDGTTIAIYGPDPATSPLRHVGQCSDWTWDVAGTTFIAACEDMTSAWLVNSVDGLQESSVAMPWLRTEATRARWGRTDGSAIGMTPDGKVRIVGFYGFPTGCEGAPCSLPPPAHSVTTFDPVTDAATTTRDTQDFIVDSDVQKPVRLSGDSSWVYADLADAGARIIDLTSGKVIEAARLGTFAGGSADGSALYGWRFDEATGHVLISSLRESGSSTVVVVIRLADGIERVDPVIITFGPLVAATAG